MDYENDYMDSRYIQSRQNKLILEYDEESNNFNVLNSEGKVIGMVDESVHEPSEAYSSIQEMIKNNYLIYVACIENKVVGFIGIEVSYVFELPKQIMRVNALAVDNNYQNKGIGKQLIQVVEKYAKINNLAAITLNSGISRKTAHIFYEKQGYSKKGYSFIKYLK